MSNVQIGLNATMGKTVTHNKNLVLNCSPWSGLEQELFREGRGGGGDFGDEILCCNNTLHV